MKLLKNGKSEVIVMCQRYMDNYVPVVISSMSVTFSRLRHNKMLIIAILFNQIKDAFYILERWQKVSHIRVSGIHGHVPNVVSTYSLFSLSIKPLNCCLPFFFNI